MTMSMSSTQTQLLKLAWESHGVIHAINLILLRVEFLSNAGLHQNAGRFESTSK